MKATTVLLVSCYYDYNCYFCLLVSGQLGALRIEFLQRTSGRVFVDRWRVVVCREPRRPSDPVPILLHQFLQRCCEHRDAALPTDSAVILANTADSACCVCFFLCLRCCNDCRDICLVKKNICKINKIEREISSNVSAKYKDEWMRIKLHQLPFYHSRYWAIERDSQSIGNGNVILKNDFHSSRSGSAGSHFLLA